MKIKNPKKFVRSVSILTFLIVLFLLYICNISFSHQNTEYMKYYVGKGESMWQIAKQQKETNSYYQKEDVRYIINHLKKINHLTNTNLKVNQELFIPKI